MSLDVPRIRALCFDVDGTLSDTDHYYAARFAGWLRRVPLVRDPERLARRLVMWMESPGNALLGLTDTIGFDDQVIAIINWMYRHRRQKRQPLPVIPDVVGMLDKINRRFGMAVISARDEHTTMAFLRDRDLLKYFPVIITALSARRSKPYPDPLRLAAQRLEVAPESCLMIGDTTVDIRCGKSAGAQTVGVLCGFGEQAELQRQGADLILQSTADLGQVLFEGHPAAIN